MSQPAFRLPAFGQNKIRYHELVTGSSVFGGDEPRRASYFFKKRKKTSPAETGKCLCHGILAQGLALVVSGSERWAPGEDGVLPGWEWACLETYANGHTGGPALREAELFQDAPSPMWCAIAGDSEGTTGEPRLPFAVQGFPPRVLYVGPPEVYSKFWWLGP